MTEMCYRPIPPKKKTLQVPVKIAWGEKQTLVVQEFTISPPSPPIFRIKDIDKEVVITQTKLVPISGSGCNGKCWRGKIIINGFVDKNINYKTITDFTPEDVNGPLFHFTTRVEFATFIEVKSDEPLRESDRVEILSAFVEGEKDDLLDPNPVAVGAPDWAVTFNRLLEKVIVKIEAKVVRIEEVSVQTDC